jgi:hypothetical protein
VADLAGVTIKAVGVLEYERRWPYPHVVDRWLMHCG